MSSMQPLESTKISRGSKIFCFIRGSLRIGNRQCVDYFKKKEENKKIKHDSLPVFSHSLEQCIIHLEGNLQHTLISSPRYDVEVDLHTRHVDLDSMNEGANLGHGENLSFANDESEYNDAISGLVYVSNDPNPCRGR
ncbi:hypothetical protein SLEP1_g10310 [Rubroshorea leprosula]|uniref:Uncharacterized protein n=1 Tax=Rubroshorea leprosula TaxID=152421 RepID=A0AAV5IDK7_9ROSI|nr:hypothetical protein SLEP1_g10310 [Rubroshorea leprosula]